jgi:hypothetical protein
MLRKFVLLLPVLISASCFIQGQSTEIGIFLGGASYKGEINPSLFTGRLLKPAVGALYRKNFNNHWAYRLGVNYGTVAGDDALSEDEYQQRRNLSFRTHILEGHLNFEFNFFKYQIANPQTRFTPFVFAGLAFYRFNPQAQLGDEWYDLQPLGTEGQGTSAYPDREKYRRFQFALPIGGGIKFRLARRFGMTVEAGARKAYTDYLDDVSTTYADKTVLLTENGEAAMLLSDRSTDGQALNNTDRQRGNASDNDWYLFGGVTFNFVLSRKYGDNCTPFKGKLR